MHDICGAFGRRLLQTTDGIEAVILAQATNSPGPFSREATGPATFAAFPTKSNSCGSDGLRCDGDLMIVADSRIDDRDRLLDTLGLTAADDLALIAAAYRRWGEECPHHLLGDYAFAIYDAARNRTFCARDHIGARPFFYALDDQQFLFASDSKALLSSPAVSDELDDDFVASALLQRRFAPRDRSFYRAIRRLEAGHCLTVSTEFCQLRRYWRPENVAPINLPDDDAYVAAARDMLDRVMDDAVAGIETPAVHLSGGLDSSLVAALAVPKLRRNAWSDPVGYCWHQLRPDALPQEEAGLTEAIRARLGLRVESPELSAAEMADLFGRDWTCEPDIRNLLHEAAIQRDASADGVDVILSGWGGDEGISFNGRGRIAELLWQGRWSRLFNEADGPGPKQRLRVFYHALRQLISGVLPKGLSSPRGRTGQSFVDPALLTRTNPFPTLRIRETSVRQVLHDQLEVNATTQRIEDWALSGRRHGIEYRYPLLDRRILEFIYGLPPHLFRQNGTRRWLMREVSKGLLPDSIRLNDSKLEPIRCAWLEQALTDAMVIVADRLDTRATEPSRARYLDMPRLRARLAAIRAGTMTGRPQALRLALQFLDFA
ncbi:hypothetical protein FSZ31_00475 [Sphingorhabdus soli]|uniref:asparagine synthase (glutamine-hydrolyzing) n=1 Tax=Flavisphingopyxis soli TaxID=2601267 RepID=A0A5C6UKB4_9SPHN|nr:asparagine synthase-related protein [Sphingorhabdus soli]TXC73277.1 hypothetical protein FSZ31_00475 [Sphingorhabdus soli]